MLQLILPLILAGGPAVAGTAAFENAVVAQTALYVCPVPPYSDSEAAGLIAVAAMVSGQDLTQTFTRVLDASTALEREIIERQTGVRFCLAARGMGDTMPPT